MEELCQLLGGLVVGGVGSDFGREMCVHGVSEIRSVVEWDVVHVDEPFSNVSEGDQTSGLVRKTSSMEGSTVEGLELVNLVVGIEVDPEGRASAKVDSSAIVEFGDAF